jgi:hypothetical protein
VLTREVLDSAYSEVPAGADHAIEIRTQIPKSSGSNVLLPLLPLSSLLRCLAYIRNHSTTMVTGLRLGNKAPDFSAEVSLPKLSPATWAR